MDLFDIAAALMVLMAGFAYLNDRYFHLPITLGMLLMALLWSLLLALGAWFEPGGPMLLAQTWLPGPEVYERLVSTLLGLLLFAGALRLNLADLAKQTWLVLVLVLVSAGFSVFLAGTASWLILAALGVTLPWLHGLLFGALIAPTDPVVVRGLLARARVSPELQSRMAGESLLGSGLAIALVVVLLSMSANDLSAEPLLWRIGGSLLLGLVTGLVAYQLLRRIDHYQVEVLILLALVGGGMVLAGDWQLSAPLAMLVAGLLLGNHGRLLAMSEKSRRHLHDFWELIGGLVNAVLVVLIVLEIMSPGSHAEYLLAALAILPVILLTRFLAVGLPITVLRRFRPVSPGTVQIMSWGGVRGGVSVALVLSLPPGPARDALVIVTAVVVSASIVIQGLTFRSLVRHIGE